MKKGYLKIPCWDRDCKELAILSEGGRWFRVRCSACNSASLMSEKRNESLADWYLDYASHSHVIILDCVVITEENPL
jgi:hypothetical protein